MDITEESVDEESKICEHNPQWLTLDQRVSIGKTRHYVVTAGPGDMFSCTAIWINFDSQLILYAHNYPLMIIYTEPCGSVTTLDEMEEWIRSQNPSYRWRGATVAAVLWVLSYGKEHLVECWLPEQNAWHLDARKAFGLLTGRDT